MVTDCQVRKLMKLLNEEQTLSLASAKSGMDEKTARKYRCLGKLPSEVSKKHSWRTREDSFAADLGGGTLETGCELGCCLSL